MQLGAAQRSGLHLRIRATSSLMPEPLHAARTGGPVEELRVRLGTSAAPSAPFQHQLISSSSVGRGPSATSSTRESARFLTCVATWHAALQHAAIGAQRVVLVRPAHHASLPDYDAVCKAFQRVVPGRGML